MDIREATITAQMPAGEFFVIDPHEVENGCVQIVNVHWVLYRTHTTVVGCAVCHTAFHTAPGHPHREAVVTVVAPHRDTGGVGRRGPPELATPKDEGVLEQPARFQVFQERGDRAVTLSCLCAVVQDIIVVVPYDVRTERQLHDTHTMCCNPSRQQTALGKTAILATATVLVEGRFFLDAVQIAGLAAGDDLTW